MKTSLILGNMITWLVAFCIIISTLGDGSRSHSSEIAMMVFNVLSFVVVIINGIITGLSINEDKEILFPALIHMFWNLAIGIVMAYTSGDMVIIGFILIFGIITLIGLGIVTAVTRGIRMFFVKPKEESKEKENKEKEVYVHRFGDLD